MKAGFIGAGKVGFSLGKYLAGSGMTITGYYSRSCKSAREAAEFTGTVCYEDLADVVRDSDVLFLTVPDGEIGKVWEQIRNLPIKNKNICHCSGSVSSTVFFDAEEKGAFCYSIHPLCAISDKYNSYKAIGRAVFSVEGSPGNLSEIKKIFENAGNRISVIDTDKKTLYHCAAVMVSNMMTALADIGMEMLEECGFSYPDAVKALTPLIEVNAEAIAAMGTEKALTGPVERDDAETIRNHMGILNGETRELYIILSKRLTEIAERKHPDRDYNKVKKELKK